MLRKHGAELLLHGHMQENSLIWISGPRESIPGDRSSLCLRLAEYRTILPATICWRIDGEPGAWDLRRCFARNEPRGRHVRRIGRQVLTG